MLICLIISKSDLYIFSNRLKLLMIDRFKESYQQFKIDKNNKIVILCSKPRSLSHRCLPNKIEKLITLDKQFLQHCLIFCQAWLHHINLID